MSTPNERDFVRDIIIGLSKEIFDKIKNAEVSSLNDIIRFTLNFKEINTNVLVSVNECKQIIVKINLNHNCNVYNIVCQAMNFHNVTCILKLNDFVCLRNYL